MLSADGTIQIGNNIYHIDLENNLVSYIPESESGSYDEFVSAQPSQSSETVRYFYLNENVLPLIDAGEPGTYFGTQRTVYATSFRDCPQADRNKDDGYEYYSNKGRMDCKVVYQPLGIFFSMIAKAHNQKKTWYGAWLGQPATMDILPQPGGTWVFRCDGYQGGDYSSYNNFNSPYFGDDFGDHNTVSRRYFDSPGGIESFSLGVRFRIGQYTSKLYYIAD